LPRTFVEGFDQQWEDFDKPRWAYLFGQWQRGGWWYYYVAALLVKLPLGWILLLSLSYRHVLRDPRIVAIGVGLPLFFLTLISSKTNMNEHVRYLWIVLPMLAVVASIGITEARYRLTRAVHGFMCVWILIAGAATFPFGISYANELFGGPGSISKYLAASGVDWSHGWVAARDWIRVHQKSEQVIAVVEPNWYPLSVVGIQFDDSMNGRENASNRNPEKPILILVSTHDRMNIERQNAKAFASARKVDLIGYCIEVYEFPFSERLRTPVAKLVVAPSLH